MLLSFLPLVAAVPRLTWRNRFILLLVGLVGLYIIQVGPSLALFRSAMAASLSEPKAG